jgi:hypothetical protein
LAGFPGAHAAIDNEIDKIAENLLFNAIDLSHSAGLKAGLKFGIKCHQT